MWFKNEKDRIMIPLTVTQDTNTAYFSGRRLKMIHLRPLEEAKATTVLIFSSISKGSKEFFKRFRYINRESEIDKLLKAMIN